MLAWTLEEPAVMDAVSPAVAPSLSPPNGRRSSALGTALFKLSVRQATAATGAETPVPQFVTADSLAELPPWEPESEPVEAEELFPAEQSDESNDSDRRAHPRHDSECDVWISLKPPHLEAGAAGRIRGRVVDVSLGGFALRTSAPITPGHRIWMRIVNRNFAQVIETDGNALRCTPQASGDWHVVCRLSRRLTFEQVNFIGKQLFASTLV